MIVYTQRRTLRSPGGVPGVPMSTADKIKEKIRQERHPELDRKEVFQYYVLDHIIPFSISNDSSEPNLQIMLRHQHGKKNGIDRKIINQFKQNGWIKSGIGNSIYLIESREKLKEEYLKLFQKYAKEENFVIKPNQYPK